MQVGHTETGVSDIDCCSRIPFLHGGAIEVRRVPREQALHGTHVLLLSQTVVLPESTETNIYFLEKIRATPLLRVKAKITVKNTVCLSLRLAAYGEFDCDFDFDSQEWSCSNIAKGSNLKFCFLNANGIGLVLLQERSTNNVRLFRNRDTHPFFKSPFG